MGKRARQLKPERASPPPPPLRGLPGSGLWSLQPVKFPHLEGRGGFPSELPLRVRVAGGKMPPAERGVRVLARGGCIRGSVQATTGTGV